MAMHRAADATPRRATVEVATPRRATVGVALLGLAAGALVALASWSAAGGGVGGLRLAARHTARLSFLLFLLAYCAGPLARLAPRPATLALLRERRGLGLGFAAAHFLHLAALLAFLAATGEALGGQAALVGGGGYLLLAVLVATSNDAAVRALGPRRWRRLHAFALHYLWLVFALTYSLRLAGDAPEASGRSPNGVYAALLALALGALGLRLAARVRARRESVGARGAQSANASATPAIASSSSSTDAARRRLLTR